MKYIYFFLQHAFENTIFPTSNFIGKKLTFPLFKKSIVCGFLLLITANNLLAEGTKELRPTSTDFGYIQIYDRGRVFATYNAPALNRLYIHICTAGEKIFFGFNQPDNDVYFRLKDPAGNIVVAAQAIPSSGTGFISTYNQAVAGPSQLVGASGYDAMSYTSLVAGDYYIEFNTGSATTIPTNTASGSSQRLFDLFDITVASGTTAKPGRLWSYSWDLNSGATNNPITAKMYILSKDSIVTSIDFNGMQPYGAVITANSTGLSNTGNLAVDRASKVGDFTLPEYQIFLNDPDNNCYPTGSFGTISAPTVVTGCDPANRCINITVNKSGKTQIVLDLNGTPGYQPNTTDLLIIADVVAGKNCIPWNSKDGKGNLITTITGIPLQVDYLNGVTNLPLYDVESNVDGYIVELVRPAGAQPSLYWDDTAINAGTVLDTKVNLTGCASTTGCHKWKNRGDNNCKVECPETINTWWYPNIVTDKLTFDMPSAVVDADNRNPSGALNDSLVCEHINTFQLSGAVDATAGGTWSGGAGTFSPSRTILNPTYTPTNTERNSGSVKLYLQSDAIGACPTAIDSVTILFEKAPIVQIASDQVICSTTKTIPVSAVLTNATTGIWTGGNGTFAAATNKSTNYTISPTDITAGNINLIFTSTGTRLCQQGADTINFAFEKPPVVQLGADQKICATTATLPVVATLINATTGIWKGGNGTFAAATNTATNYTISSADTTAGNINLIFTSTGIRVCPQEDDTINISFDRAPVVHVGTDQTICSSNKTFHLTATLINASTGIWKGGNGTFAAATSPVTNYTLSSADITAGNINLIYTSTGTTVCQQEDDTINLTFNTPVGIEVGAPITICEGVQTVNITATGDNTATLMWTGGNGSFMPSNALTTTYTLNANEINASQIDLTLTAKKGLCPDSSDVLTIKIAPRPSVNAGNDTLICKATDFTLVGSGTAAAAYKWYAIPSQNILSLQNIAILNNVSANGNYVLEASTANNCSNTDTVFIQTYDLPTLNPGGPFCYDAGLTVNANASNIPAVNANYIWKLNNIIVASGAANNSLPINTAGIYTLTYQTTGCSKDVLFTVNPQPVLSGPDSSFACLGTAITLNTNPVAGLNYTWYDSGGSAIQNGASAQVAASSSPVKYYVEGIDGNGCKNKDSIIALGTPVPILTLQDAVICADSIALLDATPNNISANMASALQFEWKYNNAVLSTNKIIQTSNAGTYFIKVSLGNCVANDDIQVTVHQLPTSSLPVSSVFCSDNGNTITLDAGPNNFYQWLPNKEQTQTLVVYTPGKYEVVIKNNFQCKIKASTTVFELCKPTLYVSNAFSPNGDHINDLYEVFEKHVSTYSMTVFSRWGEVIFLSTDKTVFWDGTYKGEVMPIGVYPYIIKYEGDSDEYKGPYTIEGSVTITK
jgi:gliding motility-associated-like protein